jgi:hypothetical protein
MRKQEKIQKAAVKLADGTLCKLAVISHNERTIFVCSIERYRRAASLRELESYAVAFPMADVSAEGTEIRESLTQRSSNSS